MHISTYFSISAAAFFLTFLPTTVAQNAISLISQLPLEIRSPYMNFWTPPYTSSTTLNATDYFFTQVFGNRTALIRIDGVTHAIFGELALANQTNATTAYLTPTRTSFTFQIGPVDLILTFFSPIEPGDWVRQSMPFSYIYFEIGSNDGNTHDVQLYMHMPSGHFFFSDSNQTIAWTTASTGESVYEMVQLQNQQIYSENSRGQAEWGQFYFATAANGDVTYGVGSSDTLVGTFSAQGSLSTIPEQNSPVEGTTNTSTVYAFARNLGSVSNATAVFEFGFVQDPAVQYVDPTGSLQRRHPYFMTEYSNTAELIDAFVGDFENAWGRMAKMETNLSADVEALGGDYFGLLCFSTRLTYASTVLTAGEAPNGSLDPTDVMMFMKNADAVTSPNRVNPVEVLYDAFPMFMYLDPTLGGPLLEPLLRYQSSGYYTQPYAAQDAGTTYPNATLTNAAHQQGVEESANMLIMMYAYARSSGNGTSIQKYYPLLKNWTDYLVDNTLYTTNQVSGDLLSVNNQTNLAIKGIIAIKAMSVMAASMSQSTDYSATANAYYNKWKTMALASDQHLLAQYKNESSWTIGYNLFADHWLQTGLISQSILNAQSNFLQQVNFTSAPATLTSSAVGIPLDSFRSDNVTYSSNLFAAGFGDSSLQNLIFNGMQSHPLLDDFSFSNSTYSLWSSSPDLGSAYAPLALTIQTKGITTANGTFSLSSHSSTARKLGLALGLSLFAALFIVLGAFFYRRRMRQGAPRFFATRRQHKRRASGMPQAVSSDGVGMKLDFIPSFGTTSKRSKREPGWKNLEDYDYE